MIKIMRLHHNLSLECYDRQHCVPTHYNLIFVGELGLLGVFCDGELSDMIYISYYPLFCFPLPQVM